MLPVKLINLLPFCSLTHTPLTARGQRYCFLLPPLCSFCAGVEEKVLKVP